MERHYQACMTSLQNYINSLPVNPVIKFIRFKPSDFTPYAQLSLAKAVVNLRAKDNEWFIGSTNRNFCYCHRRSFLELVLNDESHVDSGYHITIGFNNNPVNGLRFKIHKTEYVQLPGSTSYEKRMNECNFWFKDYTSDVRSMLCDYPSIPMINQFSNDVDLHMIETIMNVMPSIGMPGGGKKQRKRQCKKGGESIKFESETFLNFMYTKLISQIFQSRDEVDLIDLYFDENQVIGSNQTITMIIEDVLGDAQKFKIDMDTVIKACYAMKYPELANDIEKGCYAYFNAIAASIMNDSNKAT